MARLIFRREGQERPCSCACLKHRGVRRGENVFFPELRMAKTQIRQNRLTDLPLVLRSDEPIVQSLNISAVRVFPNGAQSNTQLIPWGALSEAPPNNDNPN